VGQYLVQESATADFSVGGVSKGRERLGNAVIWIATLIALLPLLLQISHELGWTDRGLSNWRPVAYAFVLWAIALCVGLILSRGPKGEQDVFLLPAALLTLAFVIFPTIYAVFIAFSDWNLSAVDGRSFNGVDNFRKLFHDSGYWNAMRNMVYYVAAVLVQYVIAFGLAALLNQNIRGRKFFRVVFLLPFMLSPVAVSFIIGKTIMNSQYGPYLLLLDKLHIDRFPLYESAWSARLMIMIMDAWYSIPFMMVLLLAGLQAIPHEVIESARVDGSSSWQTFRDMTFPLMLPVSLTAIILRVIFELKLLDVVKVVTGGGPGNYTDTVTLFIYREGIERTNVGYATALSTFYLVVIILMLTAVLWLANKWMAKLT
jgi:multiple sugar transport system permease protein